MDNYASYIEVSPKIMFGKAVIKDTRITVELLLEKLAVGESMGAILEDYPSLTKESIFAALQFAAENLKATYVYPIASCCQQIISSLQVKALRKGLLKRFGKNITSLLLMKQ